MQATLLNFIPFYNITFFYILFYYYLTHSIYTYHSAAWTARPRYFIYLRRQIHCNGNLCLGVSGNIYFYQPTTLDQLLFFIFLTQAGGLGPSLSAICDEITTRSGDSVHDS